jgi:hypothetical protein
MFVVRIFDRGFFGEERSVNFSICIGASRGHSFAAIAGFCRCSVCIPARVRFFFDAGTGYAGVNSSIPCARRFSLTRARVMLM